MLLTPFLFLTQADASHPGADIDAQLSAGRYLSALAEAEVTAGIDKPGTIEMDQYGLVLSYLSLERETLEVFDAMGGPGGAGAPLASSPVDEAEALDAIPALVAAAKDRRIVILNESHHMPRHRAFAAELARALRAEGFTWFGAETFMDIAGTEKRGYPSNATGYYVRDPVFGELVRTVLALGYRTFPYEVEAHLPSNASVQERINHRETHQAENIVKRCFDEDPEARVFLYVGYSHATEQWSDKGGKNETAWMAARLGEITGYDPLTIDQTTATPHSGAAHDDPHWRRAAEAGKLAGPKLLRKKDGSFVFVGDYAGQIDLQVFHPPVGELHGRSDWLARGRVPLALPAEFVAECEPELRLVAQAFRASEPKDAIPSDQFLVRGNESPASLLLVPGEYRLQLVDEDGEVRARVEKVTVR
jgi:hypothetical protein